MATEKEHLAAVLELLANAAASPYSIGNLPATRPEIYTEVGVARRFGGEQRGSGEREGQLYRITTRQVAKRYANAQNLRTKSADLEGAVLSIDGEDTTPIEFESADPIATDEGWFSGLQTWTYRL